MTFLQEIKARMAEMIEKKTAELAEVRTKKEEAQAAIEAADADIKAAAAEMNLANYEQAVEARKRAGTMLEMYNAKYDQLRTAEYISEADSDRVINRLLSYERILEKDFNAALAVKLSDLSELLAGYMAEVKDTENTIERWTSEIHANYSTRGGTWFVDEVSGERTDRSIKPVPVHPPYSGCGAAHRLAGYLEKEMNR